MSFDAITRYLTEPSIPYGEQAAIESALGHAERDQFALKPYLDLLDSAVAAGKNNTILLSRLTELYLIAAPLVPSDLVCFYPERYITDPFYASTVINFYVRWLQKAADNAQKYSWEAVEPAVRQWMAQFGQKSDEGDAENEQNGPADPTELALLICAVSHCRPQYAAANAQTFKYAPSQLDFCDPVHINLLARYNPAALSRADCDTILQLPLLAQKYFSVLLMMVADPNTFGALLPSLLSQKLSRLTHDYLYRLLAQMASFDHSATFLLKSLPSMVSDFLVSQLPIHDKEIFVLKRETLHGLLQRDVGMWREQMVATYSQMVNGKTFRHVEPSVAVEDMHG